VLQGQAGFQLKF